MSTTLQQFPLYDDVGSFPLPPYIDKEAFKRFYWAAYNGLIKKTDIFENRGIHNYFTHPILQSFQLKLNAGVNIVNYPQHMDMYEQFLKPISENETEPNLISVEKAIIPEMLVIEKFAKEHYERIGKPLSVKICVTGPVELYIRKIDFTVYLDMAYNFAKSVNSFIKNSLYDTKYLKTSIVSIDEPSFGYVDVVNASDDELIKIFDKCLKGVNITSQIHLHTLNRASIALQTKNIDVLTCEYASDNSNIIPKKDLDQHDKFIRVGITRTNINSLMAEALDTGVSQAEVNSFEGTMNLIDPKKRIEKNLMDALKRYDDRLRFVGPDCGLAGWDPPQVAYEVLHRTYEAIEKVKKTYFN